MFCPKCGTELIDDGFFCQKCGANLISENDEQPMSEPVSVTQTKAPKQDILLNIPEKKKPKQRQVILGMAVLAVIVTIIIVSSIWSGKIGYIVSSIWNGKIDYAATVQAHQPFVKSQGLNGTFADVLNKYMSPPDWKVRESGDIHYVDISGIIKGTDNKLVVTIEVSPDSDNNVLINPISVVLNNEKSPTQNDAVVFLCNMFSAYNEGYNDLSELLYDTEASKLQEKKPTETHTVTKIKPDSESDTFPLTTSTDAIKVFDEWASSHPSIGNYHLNLTNDAIDNKDNKIFLFTLETNDTRIFTISIRKSDGYMQYIDGHNTMSIDTWYETVWLQDDSYDSEYILANSDSEYLTMKDLKGFSANDCRLARNELYARYGRKFDSKDLQNYFNSCSWYHGVIEADDFQESILNDIEIANRDLIIKYEEKMGYR